MKDRGWIKAHRDKLQWEWFTDYKTAHLFEYLTLKASHNEFKWRGKTFKPGQLPFGLHKASLETGLSVKMIRTSLEKLKSTGEVAIETSRQGSIITIKNWSHYQDGANKGANESANEGQTRGKQRASTKNEKNEKNEKNMSKFDLEAIYAAYPRKEGKKIGLEKLESIVTTQELYDEVLKGVENYKAHLSKKNENPKFVKLFSTWVNQRCWEEEYTVKIPVNEQQAFNALRKMALEQE